MGGIKDGIGVNQGGSLDSKEYQLASNQELNVANTSGLGIAISNVKVASFMTANDTMLVSDSIHNLQSLLIAHPELSPNSCWALPNVKLFGGAL